MDRRRRRLHRPAADVGHPRAPRQWRLSHQRHLAALRRRRGERTTSRQGLREGSERLPAHVRPPSRHARDRRSEVAALRALCRLLLQVPEARLADRPVPVDHAGQHPADPRCREGQHRPDGIPGGAGRLLNQPGRSIRHTHETGPRMAVVADGISRYPSLSTVCAGSPPTRPLRPRRRRRAGSAHKPRRSGPHPPRRCRHAG
jgi:hypothetical protein